MSRPKKTPSVHKPSFDEESALRFAERGLDKEPSVQENRDTGPGAGQKPAQKPAKGSDSERIAFELMLKPQTIASLQLEAFRKGKGVNQIVDKLVAKHLDKP